jgi:hypothetical protein
MEYDGVLCSTKESSFETKCAVLNFQGKIPHHAAVISMTRVVLNEFSHDVIPSRDNIHPLL